MRKRLLLLIFSVLFLAAGCDTGGDSDSGDAGSQPEEAQAASPSPEDQSEAEPAGDAEETVTLYYVELNVASTVRITGYSGRIHIVYEYNCIDRGDSYFDVQDYTVHYFPSAKYSGSTEAQMAAVVHNGGLAAEKIVKRIMINAGARSFTDAVTNEYAVVYMPVKTRYALVTHGYY